MISIDLESVVGPRKENVDHLGDCKSCDSSSCGRGAVDVRGVPVATFGIGSQDETGDCNPDEQPHATDHLVKVHGDRRLRIRGNLRDHTWHRRGATTATETRDSHGDQGQPWRPAAPTAELGRLRR